MNVEAEMIQLVREIYSPGCNGIQDAYKLAKKHAKALPQTVYDHWNPSSKQPRPDDFGELELIQVYDVQYKFTFNLHKKNFTAMRPEWVWRRITPPPLSAPPGPRSGPPEWL